MLSPDADAPVVPQAAVGTDLLQALEVLAELVVQHVGHDLGGESGEFQWKGNMNQQL